MSQNNPEHSNQSLIEAAQESIERDIADYTAELPQRFPVSEIDAPEEDLYREVVEVDEQPLQNFFLAIKASALQLGLDGGFAPNEDGDAVDYVRPAITDKATFYIGGMELETPYHEPKSALFTALAEPGSGTRFMHAYAAFKEIPIDAMQFFDPDVRNNPGARARTAETVSHPAYEEAFKADPEFYIGVYLLGRVSSADNIVRHIDSLKFFLAQIEESRKGLVDSDISDLLRRTYRDTVERADKHGLEEHNKERLETKETELRFINELLELGYRPATMQAIEDRVQEYVNTMLIEHPDLVEQEGLDDKLDPGDKVRNSIDATKNAAKSNEAYSNARREQAPFN